LRHLGTRKHLHTLAGRCRLCGGRVGRVDTVRRHLAKSCLVARDEENVRQRFEELGLLAGDGTPRLREL